MKYRGTLILLQANKLASIYKVDNYAKVQMYISNVMGEVINDSFIIRFNSNGFGYTIAFKNITGNIYEGEIINDNKSWGLATMFLYNNENNLLCKMRFNEEGDEYDCFLELEPSK